MASRRRLRLVLVLTTAVLAVGLGLGQAFRDDTPPALWIEAPERVAAGESFELFVSADEPATFRIDYGAARIDAVDQQVRVDLDAVAGAGIVTIEATDGAGNVARASTVVTGVPIAVGALQVPTTVLAGTPFAATLRFTPEDAPVRDVALRVADTDVPLHGDGTERWALVAAPLSDRAATMGTSAHWLDGMDRRGSISAEVVIAPLDQEIQELQIAASTLAVVTPEARAIEAAVLAEAAPDAADPPRWSEPFVLPVEGRATSGFARARRYAPGGPVSFHEGEDIAAPTGTPIVATNDGVVVVAGTYPIKGGLTIIDHGAGVTSRYYHQSRIDVAVGQVVGRGDPIGAVGSTGLSTGPHLHWEMRIDDVATNPLAWVGEVRP